jgi:protein-disulfide isomerase/uncharacterized membrane protein
MTEIYNYLFQYLERESIFIDKNEFLFQMQSHPDYPSLLSVADTLSFFGIINGVVRVSFSDLEGLPNRFVTLLKEGKGNPEFCFIEKKERTYFCNKNNKSNKISESLLEQQWNGIVLLVETSEIENTLKANKFLFALPSLCLGFLVAVVFVFQENWPTNLFFVFAVLGMLFSIASLKDLFGTKSKILNKFCNITANTSCTTVVSSNKWKLFKYLNFSDLSIVFFGSQLLGLFLFVLFGESAFFLSMQKLLLLFSIPVIIASLYFQKFVEKKWCPVCLVIIAIVLFELLFLEFFQSNEFNYSIKALLLFGFSFAAVFYIWSLLKTILLKQKELKEFQLKGNRFMRNYQIFKNTLLATSKKELPTIPFILGNRDSQAEITIITNPFCGHCKNVHEILDKIIENHRDDLKIKIIFKTDIDSDKEEVKTLFRNLYQIYLEKGEKAFEEAMRFWFANKDLKIFNTQYSSNPNDTQVDTIFRLKNDWCLQNGITYTPAIFINGYEYPSSYERENLEYFMNELVEDRF